MGTRVSPLVFGCVLATILVGHAQTRIVPPSNKYTPKQDVELGLQAAQEARKQLPLMEDQTVSSYVARVGERLVAAIPAELKNSDFHYTFETVNVRDINAFALPGGPMFVNRGMIEASKSEGEVAGVMAHELSHVVLRHGTAQASKATKYELGAIAGAIVGAVIGGRAGSVVAQGTQFGLGTAFLRYGRDYEKQADIQGAQIMARAGYDPRDMATMFKTIEQEAGSAGPEWLSDHPNPGNRADYIVKEAAALRVQTPIRDTAGFTRVRDHLKTLPPAPTTEEVTKNAERRGTAQPSEGSTRINARVEPPSARMTQYNEGNVFTVSVPANWRELPSSSSVTFAPEGAYGDANGASVFTHGMEFGIARNQSRDLQSATGEFLSSLKRGNPQLAQSGGARRSSINGLAAIQVSLTNVSEATGRDESIQVVTATMRDGNLFYAIAVSPQEEAGGYQSVFQRVLSSVRFAR